MLNLARLHFQRISSHIVMSAESLTDHRWIDLPFVVAMISTSNSYDFTQTKSLLIFLHIYSNYFGVVKNFIRASIGLRWGFNFRVIKSIETRRYQSSTEGVEFSSHPMFRSKDFSHSGFLSILFAQAHEPLTFWDKRIGSSARIKRITEEIDGDDGHALQCIELTANNVNSTYITTPPPGVASLGVSLPVLVLIVKNLKRYFTYQVLILDDQNLKRRFRMTNIPGFNRRLPTVFTFPITLEEGWNELAANLSELCARVYGTRYIETIRLEIHPNCKLREVFFCERSETMKVRLAQPFTHSAFLDPVAESEKKPLTELDTSQQRLKTTYKDLANAVKVAAAPMTKRRGSVDGQNIDNDDGKDLSLAARLKLGMYFEKPAEPAKQSSNSSSPSVSRKASKGRKK